jgi:ABC-2 type transport system permease protein
MSTVQLTTQAAGRLSFGQVLSDWRVLTKRNLLRYMRIPQLLVFSTIQPVMFVLLFRYVFGGAINAPVDYADFLMPGVFVQTAVFGAMATGIGLADDLGRGMIDRFRSLPMAPSGVLAGRVISDTVRNVFVLTLMLVVGYLVGFDIKTNVFAALLAFALALGFGLAFSCISALIGLTLKDVEATQSAGFIWVFPLVFASSVFVSVETMPGWLQAFANVNPVTKTVDALRALLLDLPPAGSDTSTAVLQAIAWIVAIVAVFGPLAVRQYRRVA